MFPARNARDAHAQNFILRDELLLLIPKAFALCTRSLQATWNAKSFRYVCIVRLKRDGTRAETRFPLTAKRTGPFKSAGASVQSTAGSRGVRISGSNAGYTMFRGSVKSTGYPLHSPVFPSLPLSWVTVGHHISTRVLYLTTSEEQRKQL